MLYVKDFIKSYFPVIHRDYRLELDKIYFDPNKLKKAEEFFRDYNAQKEYRLLGKSFTVPLYADFTLYRKGKPVERAKKLLIANVPVKLPRNTYLFKGSEYFVSSQMRLKPGIYTRIKENGEVETHFNLAKWSFKMTMKDGRISIKFTKGPSIPVYTLLKILGASDDEIRRVMGDELFEKNKIYDEQSIVGWYKAYFPKGDEKDAIKEFKKALTTGFRFDPEIMEILVGKPVQALDKDVVLRAVEKFIKVRQGKEEPDDRDSLLFKQILDEEDLIREKFYSDSVKSSVLSKIKRNLEVKSTIRDIVPVSIFQSVIDSIFQMDLVNPLKQNNPVTIAENAARITILGEGGIKSLYGIPEAARAVHPSQFGFVDPIRTPESGKIGAVLFKTFGATKVGDKAAVRLIDVKTGKLVDKTVQSLFDKYISFPDQYDIVDGKIKFRSTQVKAIRRGKIQLIPASKVDYVFPDYTYTFTASTILLPFLQNVHPVRASKSANTATQALPLVHREPPLVQAGIDEDISINRLYGEQYSIRSPVDGTIRKINDREIVIEDKKGEKHRIKLSNYLPLNQQAFFTMHIRSDLKPGTKVKKGELLADSNFTKDGELAIGVNGLVAFMPYKGLNFEDGIVISESFAKKLTSQRLFHFKYELTADKRIDKRMYRSLYPYELTEDKYNKLDDEGVIKEGEIVNEGDILVAGLVKSDIKSTVDNVIGKLSRKYVQQYKKFPLVWDQEFPGKVVDVRKTNKLISITVLVEEPAVIGDKIVNNYGNKGVIVAIIPDEQMPRTKDGKVIDVIINPISILGRTNPGQIYEAIASKIAEKQRKPLIIPNFKIDDTNKFLKKLMSKYGVSDTEDLIDPSTGKEIKNVVVGYNYIYKLEHLVEKKLTARYKEGYDEWDLTPAKGVEHPAQSIGILELYSILSHNTPNLLQEMVTYKAEKNPEFWDAIENNLPPPPPKPTFVTSKFENLLRAIGVNVDKKGNLVRILPATRKDIDAIAGKEVKNAKLLVAGSLKEDKGGLFDPEITGGLMGMKWSHIKLPEKILSPIAMRAISVIADIPITKLKDLVVNQKPVNGLNNTDDLLRLLNSKSIDDYIKEFEERGKKAKDLAEYRKVNLALRFLKYMKEYNLKWEDFFLDKIPVLPPRFRPITVSRDNTLFVSDFNLLYRDIKLAADTLKEAKQAGLPENELKQLRKNLIESIEILYGLTDASSRYFGKRVPRGILDYIAGPKPKEGYFQTKVLRKTQDLSGRSVIVPDPGLHPDEIGIPEEMAWKIFEPFILAKLKSTFMLSPAQARIELAKRTDRARKALELVAKERLVLLNRAPSLHKYNVLAFRPRIVEGGAIKLPPIIVSMQAADFDGDHMNSTVILKVDKSLYSLENNPPAWYIRLKYLAGGASMASYIKLPIPFNKDDEIYIVDLEDFPHGKEVFRKDGRIFYEVPEGIEVLAYDECTGQIKWAPVKYWSKHPEREIYIVTTYHGKQIYTDYDDRAVYGVLPENMTFTRCNPETALKMKLLVPVVKKFQVKGNLVAIAVPAYTEKSKYELISYKSLTYEFGYFIGYFAGNGWVSYVNNKPKAINVSMHTDLIGSEIEQLILNEMNSLVTEDATISKHVFKKEEKPDRFEDAYRLTLTSKEAAHFMEELVGKGAFNKHLPPFFLVADENFRRGLLTGYLDADGSFGISRAKKNPQLMVNASTGSLRLAREIVLLAKSLGITASITGYKSTFSGKQHWMITFSNHELLAAGLDFKNPKHVEKIKQFPVIKRSGAKNKQDLVPFSDYIYRLSMHALSKNEQSSYRRYTKKGYISRYLAKKLIDKAGVSTFLDDPVGTRWIALVINESISWSPIKSVEKTGIKETGYDLTVPGFETFMNVEGVVLSNTTAIHVPVTKEALEDAIKMLPSQNWLHEAQPGKVWLTPKIEAILGLYRLTAKTGKKTNKVFKSLDEARQAYNRGEIDINDVITINGQKTTLGRALVNDILPPKYRDPNIVLDRKSLSELMRKLFEEDQHKAAEIASKLNKLGAEFAYYTGATVSLKDLEPIDPSNLEKASIVSLKTEDPEKVNKMADQLRKQVRSKLLRSENNFVDFIKSGSRANIDSLMQMIASPIQLQDYTGRPFPYIVSKGYSKGLDFVDYLVSSFGARTAAIEKVVQTGEPGELTKEMVASAIDYRITMEDCGTKKGIVMDIDTADALDRLLAEDVKVNGKTIAKRNEPMEGEVVERLKKAKVKKVKVRSPLTCEAPQGICAMCYGLGIDKQLPKIGEYVGVKTAQYLSEPATQMALSSIHTGGVVKDIGSDFKSIKNLLELHIPEASRATLAKNAGTVESVKRRPEGGWEIVVDGKTYVTSPWVEPIVKKGDKVEKGQRLTTGMPHPKDLYDISGPEAAKEFVADYLDKAYQENGVKLHRRNFEIISKVMFDTAMITDPGDTDFVIGDTATVNMIKKKNSELGTSIELPVTDAEGRVLAENVAGFSAGHKLSKDDISKLKSAGVRRVKVVPRPATYKVILRGVEQLPLLRDDWLARLAYRDIKNTIIEGALRGWSSDLTGWNPIPRVVYGKVAS